MMIHTIYKNNDIMIIAQCSVNIIKAVKRNMDSCNGDYKDVAKGQMMEIPSKRIQALPREKWVLESPPWS